MDLAFRVPFHWIQAIFVQIKTEISIATRTNQQMQSKYSQWNIVPTVNIPKAKAIQCCVHRHITLHLKRPLNITYCASLIEPQDFTAKCKPKIQRWEQKMAKPMTTEIQCKDELTCLSHILSHVLVMIPVFWSWHAPAKIKHGGHFGVLTGMLIFSAYNRAQENHLQKTTCQNWACDLLCQCNEKDTATKAILDASYIYLLYFYCFRRRFHKRRWNWR